MSYIKVVKKVSPKGSHHKKKMFYISLILYLYDMMDFTKLIVIIIS